MGLFRSKKKQTEKDREYQQWEEINSPEAIAAFNQEKAMAASLFDRERTLICGDSMFLNIMVKDFTGNAENVEILLSMELEKLLAKCKEFRPTILILTGEPADLLEFSKQIIRECPGAAIVASSKQPEELPYAQSELRNAHVYAVLRKPFAKEDFLTVIQNIRNNK